MFSLRASSVGNRSKERGWVYPSQLYDRLAKSKNTEGRGLLTASSVTHSKKKKKKAQQYHNIDEPADIC